MYIHMGSETVSQHNIFDLEKLKFFLCSCQGSKLRSWNPLELEPDALPVEPPPSPLLQ